MNIYDEHLWWTFMMNIFDGHLWWTFLPHLYQAMNDTYYIQSNKRKPIYKQQ